MRSLILTAGIAIAALAAPAVADPQAAPPPPPPPMAHAPMGGQMGAHMPMPGPMMNRPPIGAPQMHPPMAMPQRQMRWGPAINGHWQGGMNAPGGWNGYRRPVRGWSLPRYWVSPRFYINDWSGYGLGQPPYGYNWARYYDDAVLIDRRGSVYDSVSGLDWDRYDGGDDVTVETVDAGAPYPAPGYDDRGGPDHGPVRVERYERRERHDDGVGGAVIGGVVGGVAGNVIAGRGNRLLGTAIGAGVGAVAGAAIDRAEDRGRDGMRRGPDDRGGPGYGADYPPPPAAGERRIELREVHRGPAMGYDDRAYADHGYAAPAYATRPYTTIVRGRGSVTTVTVVPAVTTTTTTTEYVQDARPSYRRVVKRSWKPKPRQCSCVCRTVCR